MRVGLHLARLEMNAIFSALATRVKRFHIQQEVRNLNNVLRGLPEAVLSVVVKLRCNNRPTAYSITSSA